MIKDTDMIAVQNKINATVVYQIPDLNNLVREYRPNEIKKVPMDELRRLSSLAGGLVTLQNYLFIDNKEAVEELIGNVEPEYFYTQEDIKELLENGSLEQFEDFMNFAPTGMKETLKDLAVSLELNDNRKREMIKKYLGFDVTKAIELVKDDESESTPDYVPQAKERKATPVNKESNNSKPVRKYNVVKD